MQFLAALVEHLVVGIVALLWGLPLANAWGLLPDVKIADHKEILIAVGLPVAYIVGMYIDVFVAPLFFALRKWIYKRHGLKKFFGATLSGSSSAFKRTATILVKSPDETAKYLLQLSGRAKIARGASADFIVAAVVNACVATSTYTVHPLLLSATAIVSFFVWLRLAALTDQFKDNCCRALALQ
jgi:hypothetical protein